MNKVSNQILFITILTWLSLFASAAHAQTTTQTQQHHDPSGITATVQVRLTNNIPKTVRYELKNTAPTDQTVWLPKDRTYIKEFISIFLAGETLETAYPRAMILRSQPSPLTPTATTIAPDESIIWNYDIVDLLKNKTEFENIENFERFGINIRFPYLVANPDENITSLESRTGVSLRWSWTPN